LTNVTIRQNGRYGVFAGGSSRISLHKTAVSDNIGAQLRREGRAKLTELPDDAFE
jgi:hypothetical protein